MQQYKFYFLDERGHVFRAVDREMRDDVSALEVAQTLSAMHAIEVWQGSRQVARVKPGDAPSSVYDRQSG